MSVFAVAPTEAFKGNVISLLHIGRQMVVLGLYILQLASAFSAVPDLADLAWA